MADESSLRLEAVSVVVTAEYHNPSILSSDFLKLHKIVPPDWILTETLITPLTSVVKYANGVEWTVDQSRLIVAEHTGPSFEGTDKSHDLMKNYLRVLPHVPYRALGLNCRAVIFQEDPRAWLLDRFGANWLRGDVHVCGMKLAVALETQGAMCNITLDAAERSDQPCVVADCNVHHADLLDVDALQGAISQWPQRKPFVQETLHALLEGQHE